jgi:hypothetical protein
MKPSRFRYAKPASLDETYELLARYGEGAILLAGGQSLLAGLGMRLAAPDMLVDINGIEGLSGISVQNGEVVIGALTRHAEVLSSPIVAQYLPAADRRCHRPCRSCRYSQPRYLWRQPCLCRPGCGIARLFSGTARDAGAWQQWRAA